MPSAAMTAAMTAALSSLTPEDREALIRSASDLSDIDPRTLADIRAGFARAYERARGIADGTIDPLR